MTAYLLSASVRNQDPACMVFHSLLSLVDFWRSTKPIPNVLTSVWRRVSLVVSKYARVGEEVSTFLAYAKASLWGCAHRNLFRVLSNGRSGANTFAMSLVLEESWLTRPKKERRSVRMLGVGNCAIASVMSFVANKTQSKAKCFIVFDALKGYHQCPLDEESQKLTTFITPFGRFKYLRAP